jgi:hypothetical protein
MRRPFTADEVSKTTFFPTVADINQWKKKDHLIERILALDLQRWQQQNSQLTPT